MSEPCPLTHAFSRSLPSRISFAADPECSAALVQAIEGAQKAQSDVDIAPELVVMHAARRWATGPVCAQEIAALHWADVWLACACGVGDEAAIAIFERQLGPVIDRAVRRLDGPNEDRAEAAQRARAHLLVAETDTAPRISQYSGRAPLSSFVRVVASRVALRMLRKRAPGDHLGDDPLVHVADDRDDPELTYLKSRYREEFRNAFAAALGSLSPRARALLRYQLVDGLNLNKLAEIYDTPRSTIGRHAQQARTRLIEGTRNHLRQSLKMSPSELDSVLRLVESSADVSVSRLLREGSQDPSTER